VLSNLLDNAVRHTPAGGYVKVGLSEAGNRARIDVENSGPDIPAQLLPRLFDRFYRADQARSESREHAGLGLAITRSIIQAHGGTIGCESKDGVTRFWIELPG
jgi:two-component system heavy metal sensor histidine kinase CusS